ncbi:hypothetical protein KCP73_19700 [Salmonella enterica subsp. enterica]|nr:hypothetical protein KCP73_19700 [Salmonella enterica subsp. enterica]
MTNGLVAAGGGTVAHRQLIPDTLTAELRLRTAAIRTGHRADRAARKAPVIQGGLQAGGCGAFR